MKKLYKIVLIALSVMLLAGPAWAVPQPTWKSWSDMSKDVALQGEPVRVLKLVRYSSRQPNQNSISSGDVVVYDTNSDDGVTVRLTTTSADGAIAGIAQTTIASADGDSTVPQDDAGHRNWGYIMVHGYATAHATAGGTNGNSIGDFFITSSDSSNITTIKDRTSNLASAGGIREVGAKGGFFFDAGDGTSQTVDVFVELE